MSEPKSNQEPTMDEILASIRRIIAEGEVDGEQLPSEGKSPSEIGNKTEALIAETSAREDDVFELTQEVQEDGTVVDIASGETMQGPDAPEVVEVGDAGAKSMAAPAAPPNAAIPLEEGLVGPPADAASTASFENLAYAVVGERTGSGIGGRTIEEVVKEVVRPIVKEWLDENLPETVERLISREINRMTRRAEDAADL